MLHTTIDRFGGTFDFPATGDTSLQFHCWIVHISVAQTRKHGWKMTKYAFLNLSIFLQLRYFVEKLI